MTDKRPFDDLFDALQRAPRASHVFGEAIRLGDLEAIPVTTYRIEIGLPAAEEGERAPHLRAEGNPLGFLAIVEGAITFVPIATPRAEDANAPRWAHEAFARIDEIAERLRVVEDAARRIRRRGDAEEEHRDAGCCPDDAERRDAGCCHDKDERRDAPRRDDERGRDEREGRRRGRR